MKKIIFATALFAFTISFNTSFAQNFKFEKETHDFGVVKSGKDTLWVDFKFINDGSEPLVISDVKTSCDCTLANWPKNSCSTREIGGNKRRLQN